MRVLMRIHVLATDPRCLRYARAPQGATLTGDVHILLNAEIFAEGMAYTALSRVQRLDQLHLWCLNREAIKANPNVDREYVRLAHSPLDEAAIAAAPRRTRVRHLLPLA